MKIAAEIIKVRDVKYDLRLIEGGGESVVKVTAVITAEVDTDKIVEVLEREVSRKSNES